MENVKNVTKIVYVVKMKQVYVKNVKMEHLLKHQKINVNHVI